MTSSDDIEQIKVLNPIVDSSFFHSGLLRFLDAPNLHMSRMGEEHYDGFIMFN